MPVSWFSSVQDCIFALGKAHMRSTPSLRSYLGQRDLLLIFRIVSNFNTLKTKGAGETGILCFQNHQPPTWTTYL